tara:strand:- start:48341 stop:49579 length:1239 start_codon:yes stop_codon:yes gene_type:complete
VSGVRLFENQAGLNHLFPATAYDTLPKMNSPHFEPVNSSNHVPALDGIRGVAILLVLFFHSGLIITSSGIVGHVYDLVSRSCWCGVDLFFVLSGYLITGILLDSRENPHFFRNFYLRRILRIFPLYYGVILWLFFQNPDFPDQIWYLLYLQNWGPVFGGSTPPMVVQPFWSLAIEEQFYLFWPFVIYLLNRRYVGVFCGLMILTAIVLRCVARYQGVDPMTIYTLTLFRLDTLSAGALIAVWLRDAEQRKRLERFAFPSFVILVLALIAVIVSDGGFRIEGLASQTIGYSLFAGICALLIAFLVMNTSSIRPLKRFLELDLLRYFGNRSYAIYIFQMMVLIPLNQLYLLYWKESDVSGWSGVLTFCVGVAIILVLSTISWHCYEKQFLKLKRFFPRHAAKATHEPEPVVQES